MISLIDSWVKFEGSIFGLSPLSDISANDTLMEIGDVLPRLRHMGHVNLMPGGKRS